MINESVNHIITTTYPFMVYLFYMICSKNYNSKQLNIIFSLAVWSSLCLGLRYDD